MFGYSCRTLALDQLQKADNGEDHSSWAGNAAWVNSITRYSPSTQCGRFSRRSAPLFEFQRQFGDLPLQPQQDRRHQAEAASQKSAHVDIAWRCGLLKVNPYLLQDAGHYVNPPAVAWVCVVFFSFLWRNYRRLNSDVCDGTNGNLQRCHSSLQIKPSCFREIAVQPDCVSGGWNLNLICLCCLCCQISLSCCFALTVCVCVFFSQVQLCHLHQIFHIMVFVLVHSMCLFLSKRQLHKMMLRIWEDWERSFVAILHSGHGVS